MPYCECGQHVSADYARVNADNNGVLHACFNCTNQTAMLHGKGAGLERGDHL